MTENQESAKRKLAILIYPQGKLQRGGLTRAANALQVAPGTIREWCIGDWVPAEATAKRILRWISSKPKIFHRSGRPRVETVADYCKRVAGRT